MTKKCFYLKIILFFFFLFSLILFFFSPSRLLPFLPCCGTPRHNLHSCSSPQRPPLGLSFLCGFGRLHLWSLRVLGLQQSHLRWGGWAPATLYSWRPSQLHWLQTLHFEVVRNLLPSPIIPILVQYFLYFRELFYLLKNWYADGSHSSSSFISVVFKLSALEVWIDGNNLLH